MARMIRDLHALSAVVARSCRPGDLDMSVSTPWLIATRPWSCPAATASEHAARSYCASAPLVFVGSQVRLAPEAAETLGRFKLLQATPPSHRARPLPVRLQPAIW
jgi:hypothetical protein